MVKSLAVLEGEPSHRVGDPPRLDGTLHLVGDAESFELARVRAARARPVTPPAVDHAVAHDREEKGARRASASVDRLGVLPSPEERILDDLLGTLTVAAEPQREVERVWLPERD